VTKRDPGLKFLETVRKTAHPALADESIFSLDAATGRPTVVAVLLEFTEDLAAIEALGFKTRSVAGNIASGEIEINQLDELEKAPNVVRVEASRALYRDLDVALTEIRANLVHSGPPGNRGAGTIVGIIDTGIDFQHDAFRRPDGTSRILAIWDQGLNPQGGESSPAGFTYGVEYRQSDIDAALGTPNPLAAVRHEDVFVHGTHVSGIAAGDGSGAGGGQPANTFVGVAPEADIIVVANNRGRAATERGLGDSADTLDAVRYIFDFAASLRRPVVINQSQGDNIGPHDGTSLLERGLDNLLGGAGRAMVKSAGNEGSLNCHASGSVVLGGTVTPSINMPTNRTAPVTIDIWYPGADRIDLTVTPPTGGPSQVFTPGNTQNVALGNGNQVFVDSTINDPSNGDNRIFIVIQRGSQARVEAGTWNLTIQGQTITIGQWDAWIQRGDPRPQFLPPHANPARTISIPGTSQKVITAASYITKGPGVGSISSFSSLGPTRDGRAAPTIAAPGETITAPTPAATGDTYGAMRGTSMAAPMITGTIALMFEKDPSLTQQQVRDCLTQTARTDAMTGATPNNAWGAGKLDTQAAFNCVGGRPVIPTLQPPCLPTVRPPCLPTVRPPCLPPTRPPLCVRPTLTPPCWLLTVRPPCPIRTVNPPCPIRTIQPPCPIRTIAPPCPVLTVGPGCPRPTLDPGCLRPTLGPGCHPGIPPVIDPRVPGGHEMTSAGWGATDWYDPYASAYAYTDPASYGWDTGSPAVGWEDPYDAAWGYDPYAHEAATWSAQAMAEAYAQAQQWDAAMGAATDASTSSETTSEGTRTASSTAYWHGNRGYS
jgi:subtilisin family serine protease